MLQKPYQQKICLFYILILLLWGTVSSAASASEMTGMFCGEEECYVNRSPSAITSAGQTFPSQKYLSARDFGGQQTVSAAKGRSNRPLLRSVRNHFTVLCKDVLSFHALFCLESFWGHGIPSHCSCSIMITNYIHQQDGQKS